MHLSLVLYLAVAAWPLSGFAQASENCRHIIIPISVSVPLFELSTTIENNWDAAALTFNFTRRNAGSRTAPLPIAGMTSTPVESNFTISANLCGTGKSILILTHGILESSLYVTKLPAQYVALLTIPVTGILISPAASLIVWSTLPLPLVTLRSVTTELG
jgi:hypothetical protein